MFCSKCGNKSPSGARFCQKCGAKMGTNNETAHLLNHPASLAELGGDSSSRVEPTPVAAEQDVPAANDTPDVNQINSANFTSYNVVPNRTPEVKPVVNNKRRSHMTAPTPSADMDYTFYPGQTAESDLDESALNNASESDPMGYTIEPTFPKLAKRNPRIETSARFGTQSVTPGLPAPESHAVDVADFSGYQILPAAYKPVEHREQHTHYDRVQVQHVDIVNTGAPEPQPMPVYTPEPQPMPVYEPEPQPMPAYMPEPQPAPAYTPEPQPMPVYAPEPQSTPVYKPQPQPMPSNIPQPPPTHIHAPNPQPVPVHAQSAPARAQVIIPQPQLAQPPQTATAPAQPLPMQYDSHDEHSHQQEEWYAYDEPDNPVSYKPLKKSKLPIILAVMVLLVIGVGAAIFFVGRIGSVNPSHLVGTWEQSPPLGTWIPRLEFGADGTGRFYQFNTAHDVSRNEIPFTWSIENGNMMRNSLWPELAYITVDRSRPPRFRYRRESTDSWQAFVMVVEQN